MEDVKRILKVLNTSKGLTLEDIAKKTSLNYDDVRALLNDLEDKLKVAKKNKSTYIKTEDDNHIAGTLEMSNRGFGFVVNENGDKLFIPKNNLNGALQGDTILVVIDPNSGRRKYGQVIKKIATVKRCVGTVCVIRTGMINKEIYAKLDNLKYPFPIVLKNTMGTFIDHKVLVEINDADDKYTGNVIEVLGHKNAPGIDVLSIVKEFGIRDTFSKEIMEEISCINDEVKDLELVGRTDLRNLVTFTIDGEDAKDLDDAVSIKKLVNNNYELGVHIADVSNYVKEKSFVDKEANIRGNSNYLADRVIPMLPQKLSNGICSLNPGNDRLTISCIMEIDSNGYVINFDIFPSVINSHKRMTYKDVNLILDGKKVPGYENYVSDLKNMQELSHNIRNNKEHRGSINFDVGEIQLVIDENGKAVGVLNRNRGEGERIIEDFMIVANESVATYAADLELPFIYRVHEDPDKEKLDTALKYIKTMNYNLNIDMNHGPIRSKNVSEELNKLKYCADYSVVANLLLRGMKKARYSNSNKGHFALASKRYCHFTSPIRRYSDLIVHRSLHKIFDNTYDWSDFNKLEQKYYGIAETVSKTEVQSILCEREVNKMKSAEYLADQIGNSYEGLVTWADKRGMFVELRNKITGLIRTESLDDYKFNEDELRFTSINNDKIYSLGTPIKVVLVKSNKETRTIEFIIDDSTKIKQYSKK